MGKLFDGKMVFTQIPLLLKYLPVTMELAVTAMIASLVLGLLLALVKIKKVPVLKQLVSIYISVIRGTPILVQLYVTYFGIPMLLKYINFKCGTNYNVNGVAPIVYAFVALALNESAFNAEIIRASLESVDKGQVEAASALGMNYFQALIRIILPEATVVALPSLGNAFIGLIKGTSLAFVCSVVEMTAEGKILAGRNYRYFEVYISLAIIYWVITFVLERVISYLEKKLRVPEDAPALLDIRDTEVTEEWQRAGVHYVRTQAMCLGFKIPLEGEFSDDTPEDEYILVMDGIYPVSTCRLHYLDEHTGKIERVATLESYRGKHYGQAGIIEAENWMREKGVTKIYINSRKAALGFYEKLGYTADFSQVSGSGEFECVMTEKELA